MSHSYSAVSAAGQLFYMSAQNGLTVVFVSGYGVLKVLSENLQSCFMWGDQHESFHYTGPYVY